MDAVIPALISGLCVAIPSLVATITTNKRSQALITYRIDQLEQKVQKHNNLVDRTYHLEEECHILDEKMRVANHRIDDLEHK